MNHLHNSLKSFVKAQYKIILCFKVLLLINLLAACSTGVSFNPSTFFKGKNPQQRCQEYQNLSLVDAQTKMNLSIFELQNNIERSLVFREKMTMSLEHLNKLTEKDEPISPLLIDKLSQAVNQEIVLIRPILTAAAEHGCWLDNSSPHIEPLIKQKGNVVALATIVSLYDEYRTVVAVLNENERLRRLLNNADSGYQRDEHLLESLTQLFIRTDMLSYAKSLSELYTKDQQVIKDISLTDKNLSYLIQVIEHSKSFPMLIEMDLFDAAKYRSKIRRRVTRDTLNSIGRSTVNALSEGFSNAVGDYEDRKGLLYQNKIVEYSLASQLKMGDILLEKTPFRLTDSMIPGHWGHAAIWVGTEAELKSIGLWQHPLVVKHQQQIKAGQLVAESLRSGTQLSSLSHFLNVDDVAIVRSKIPQTKQELREIVILALRQLGKSYDFNFDVETTDKIVCSQLVYLAYSHIHWPTESTLGRYTISPDNIAVKTFDDGPLSLQVFFHQGQLVPNNQVKLMKRLMEEG